MDTLDIILKAQTEMRAENRADHTSMVEKVDAGFAGVNAAFAAHAREDDTRFTQVELKLQPLIELRNGVVWAKRTFYGSAIVLLLAEFAHLYVRTK